MRLRSLRQLRIQAIREKRIIRMEEESFAGRPDLAHVDDEPPDQKTAEKIPAQRRRNFESAKRRRKRMSIRNPAQAGRKAGLNSGRQMIIKPWKYSRKQI